MAVVSLADTPTMMVLPAACGVYAWARVVPVAEELVPMGVDPVAGIVIALDQELSSVHSKLTAILGLPTTAGGLTQICSVVPRSTISDAPPRHPNSQIHVAEPLAVADSSKKRVAR